MMSDSLVANVFVGGPLEGQWKRGFIGGDYYAVDGGQYVYETTATVGGTVVCTWLFDKAAEPYSPEKDVS